MANEVVPFGKYKGKPVEALAQDRQYCEWLVQQDWFREKFQPIYTVIVNNFGEPSETPEHNALQARFTDQDFCRRFLWKAIRPRIERAFAFERGDALRELNLEDAEKYAKNGPWGAGWRIPEDDPARAERARQEIRKAQEAVERKRAEAEILRKLVPEIVLVTAEFEVRGIDVLLSYAVFEEGRDYQLAVECKPWLADDYPAVLRQIASHADMDGKSALLVGMDGYTGTGATLEQVRAIFQSRRVPIVFLEEIQ